MAKVIIFGLADFASLAHYYLSTDSEHEVIGFSVSDEYMPQGDPVFEGLPVVPFSQVAEHWPSSEFSFFAPMAPRKMSTLREKVYDQIVALGYDLISYVSSKATSFGNVRIGRNCFILEDNTIQPFVQIGDNVVLWSGNHIGHHSTIGDHTFFTSHVVLSGHCVVERNCFFGVNSTIRDGLTIAQGTFVAMASSVMRSTEAWGVYKGNPAEKAKISSMDLRS
ncbi:MAG: acetyltransferase [Prosthecobacter sp.]|uniref:acetyltransferase n=1 Tax=Prosthecobacter sp. TaxID=1965333 RepID=UPI0025EDCD40|nr:acetyltransferase [Prosthecobacter sp.]MCF7787396.1 acetyltransferase [Prosthecobacter sp.]